VLYLFVVAFLFAAFYFYSRSVKTERQLTQVVRHIAVMEAKRGGPRETF
jgi:small membrane protein